MDITIAVNCMETSQRALAKLRAGHRLVVPPLSPKPSGGVRNIRAAVAQPIKLSGLPNEGVQYASHERRVRLERLPGLPSVAFGGLAGIRSPKTVKIGQ